MKNHITLLFLLISLGVKAQNHDYFWVFGSGGGGQSPLDDSLGITQLGFINESEPILNEHQEWDMNFDITNTSISDSTGNLQFYTNGEKIYGPQHSLMENGDSIASAFNGYGYKLPQGALALPWPEHAGQYILITVEDYPGPAFGWKLFSHTIDMNLNGGLGKVVNKRHLLVQDSINWGRLSAVKHANGRDWWFYSWRQDDKVIYTGLLTPTGITIDTQNVAQKTRMGGGQVTITPDGTKMIRADHKGPNDLPIINIFDLDRCTGQLKNQQNFLMDDPTQALMGCSVSPNSRWLYVHYGRYLFQYDLQAEDIKSTEILVGEWDGSYYFVFPLLFWLGQTGPDGRIYINAQNSNKILHYINFPNRPGEQCEVLNQGLQFPTLHQNEMPNFPNYRLGPVDGSACDTLGLNNHPLANFRWDVEDTLTTTILTFTDLSAYEPTHWHWNFGDGTAVDTTASGEIRHTFPGPGTYTVCLIASNAYSSDTLCQEVKVTGVSSATEGAITAGNWQVFPNPADERVVFSCSDTAPKEAIIRLINSVGQTVVEKSTAHPTHWLEIPLAGLPSGMYYYQIQDGDRSGPTGKLLIQH